MNWKHEWAGVIVCLAFMAVALHVGRPRLAIFILAVFFLVAVFVGEKERWGR
jgi:hypothetical protein